MSLLSKQAKRSETDVNSDSDTTDTTRINVAKRAKHIRIIILLKCGRERIWMMMDGRKNGKKKKVKKV
jgi:hypothetical protein